MRYAIIQKKDEISQGIADKIKDTLNQHGWIEDTHPELVFAVGGDGTFLVAVHEYLNQLDELKIIGVHTGTLGFMTDYQADEIDIMMEDVLSKEAERIDELRLLEIHVDDKVYYALNEMRLENITKTQMLDIEIDGIFLETFRGSGVCISTQMGSTAFNRSIKGAVIQHGLALLQLSEIAGIHHREYQSLGNPLIMKEDACIELYSESFDGAVLCYDNRSVALDGAKTVKCINSDKKVRVARYCPYHYISRLKNLF